MENPTLDSIKNQLVAMLNRKYGYAGLADGPKMAIINSGGDGEDFRITIEDKSEEGHD